MGPPDRKLKSQRKYRGVLVTDSLLAENHLKRLCSRTYCWTLDCNRNICYSQQSKVESIMTTFRMMHKIKRKMKSVQGLYLVYILRKGIIPANHNSDINNKFVYMLCIVIKATRVYPLPAIYYPKQSHTVPKKHH